MKKIRKILSPALAALMLAWAFVGCSQETVDIHRPGSSTYDDQEHFDLSLEMVPLTEFPAIFTVPMPSASGTRTNRNQKAEIDYSNAADGYVHTPTRSSKTGILMYIRFRTETGLTA
jgi:hypothetical protein